MIGEPYNGSNPDLQKWIAYANWTYTRSFAVAPSVLSRRVVQLVSLGIDTIADVYINDKLVIQTDNMFQRLRVDVKPALVAGNNTIRVEFFSKVVVAVSTGAVWD